MGGWILVDNTWTYTWENGYKLASLTSNGVTWSYTYDADGLRTGRTDGTNTYQYIYAGDKLVRMIYNGEVVDISYAGSQPLSLTYDGATYYYVLNGQGDVIGLTNSSGKMVIGYTFGAYGVATGLVADPELSYVLVQMNPLTYRGYVYDRETKFFYLQSRYYDPEIGRWLTPEPNVFSGAFDEAAGYLKYNTYAYCINNPVKYADYTGEGIILTCVLVFAGLGALFGAAIAAEKSNEQLGYIDGRWVLGGALVGGGAGALVGWGVGILFGPTSQVIGTLTPGLYQTWQQAEQGLRNLYDGVSKAIMTDYGKRVVDCLSNGVAYEAKYGYTRLTKFILRQIEKDIWLLTNGYVDSVEWHFFWSSASNTGGASQQLIDTLLNAGIKVVFH